VVFFKKARGPLGIGTPTNTEDIERDIYMYSITNNVLGWNGNIDAGQSEKFNERKQLISLYGRDRAETNVKDELKLIRDLRKQVGDLSILPNVHALGKTTGYVEWYDSPLDETDTREAIEATIQIVSGLREVVLTAGYLNTDIKVSNIRIRKDGNPVIVDWGGGVKIKGHVPTFITSGEFLIPAVPQLLLFRRRSSRQKTRMLV
jgi:hypothetical protein